MQHRHEPRTRSTAARHAHHTHTHTQTTACTTPTRASPAQPWSPPPLQQSQPQHRQSPVGTKIYAVSKHNQRRLHASHVAIARAAQTHKRENMHAHKMHEMFPTQRVHHHLQARCRDRAVKEPDVSHATTLCSSSDQSRMEKIQHGMGNGTNHIPRRWVLSRTLAANICACSSYILSRLNLEA